MAVKRREEVESEIELRPDGWQRFEAAVDAATRTGPLRNAKVKKRPAQKTTEKPARRKKS